MVEKRRSGTFLGTDALYFKSFKTSSAKNVTRHLGDCYSIKQVKHLKKLWRYRLVYQKENKSIQLKSLRGFFEDERDRWQKPSLNVVLTKCYNNAVQMYRLWAWKL